MDNYVGLLYIKNLTPFYISRIVSVWMYTTPAAYQQGSNEVNRRPRKDFDMPPPPNNKATKLTYLITHRTIG